MQIVRNIFEKAEREHAEHMKECGGEENKEEPEKETKPVETKQPKEKKESKKDSKKESKKKSSAIYEVTDEEAATLQKEIDEEKYVKIYYICYDGESENISVTMAFHFTLPEIRKAKKNQSLTQSLQRSKR